MKKDNSKSTILVISMGFLILFIAFRWQWALYVSLATGLTGILSGYMSRLIDKGWMKLSGFLGKIVPSVMLGIVFYLFLFPLSLVSRLFSKDPLMLSGRHESYFVDVQKEFDRKDMEKIW
jgi:hypothetical protein